jgi:hypothetical protein
VSIKSPTAVIQLPTTLAEQNQAIETTKEMFQGVQDPSGLDAATTNAGRPAFLLNFYLATQADLSPMGLGTVVYIPVQITEREGGRKSVYFLDQNEEALIGSDSSSTIEYILDVVFEDLLLSICGRDPLQQLLDWLIIRGQC